MPIILNPTSSEILRALQKLSFQWRQLRRRTASKEERAGESPRCGGERARTPHPRLGGNVESEFATTQWGAPYFRASILEAGASPTLRRAAILPDRRFHQGRLFSLYHTHHPQTGDPHTLYRPSTHGVANSRRSRRSLPLAPPLPSWSRRLALLGGLS